MIRKRRLPLALVPLLFLCRPGASQPHETCEERMIAPGVRYRTIRRTAGPQVIRVIEIERLAGFIRALPAPAAERA